MRTEARRTRVLDAAIGSTVLTAMASPSDGGAVVSLPVRTTTQVSWTLRRVVVGVIALIGLTWDLWTKHEVFARLGYGGDHPVWKGQVLGVSIRFQLATALNQGALWGIGQGKVWLFASLSFVAIGAIAYFLWNRQAVASRWLTTVTGLLLAGTLGNLYDRLGLHGLKAEDGTPIHAVRDFLDFFFFNDSFHWATFNFADTYLVVGGCMLALYSFLVPEAQAEPTPTPPAL